MRLSELIPFENVRTEFIENVAPIVCELAQAAGIYMAGFVIAQCCVESNFGQSAEAKDRNIIIGDKDPSIRYGSWNECLSAYFNLSVVNNGAAKAAKTFDAYAAVLFKGENNLLWLYGDIAEVGAAIWPVYANYELSKYDGLAETSNKCEEFVQKALSYVGTSASSWQASHPNWYDPRAWCADFVSACGEEVDILGKVFDGSASAYVCAHSVENYGGVTYTDSTYAPRRGDLINFMWKGGSLSGGYADHIGIVTDFSDGTVYTVEGNTSNSVGERSYPRTSSVLACFCSPDWSKVGGYSSSSGKLISGKLFNSKNTRKDAILRESLYISPVYEFNTLTKYDIVHTPTSIPLSIINYTDLFQSFWDVGSSQLRGSSANSANSEYDYSKLDSKVRNVITYLVGKGFNNAAACGIAGNIYYESSFNAGCVGDNNTSFGLCQWHNARGVAMKVAAGSDWANNVSGQLDFLWNELQSSYSSVFSALQAAENSESGAKQCADVFVRKFEIPANVDAQSIKRQEKAAEYYNLIVPIAVSSSATEFNSVNFANLAEARKQVVARAYQELGKPYEWGAVGPNSYDCSGLVGYCLTGQYSRLGTTGDFARWPHTQSPQPGDVCLYDSGGNGHTGIYIGDSQMIHAPRTGDVVKIGPVRSNMWYCVYPGLA